MALAYADNFSHNLHSHFSRFFLEDQFDMPFIVLYAAVFIAAHSFSGSSPVANTEAGINRQSG